MTRVVQNESPARCHFTSIRWLEICKSGNSTSKVTQDLKPGCEVYILNPLQATEKLRFSEDVHTGLSPPASAPEEPHAHAKETDVICKREALEKPGTVTEEWKHIALHPLQRRIIFYFQLGSIVP